MKRFLTVLGIGSIPFILIVIFQLLAQHVHYLFNIGTIAVAGGAFLLVLYFTVRAIINSIKDKIEMRKANKK